MGGTEPFYDEHFERFVYRLSEGNPGALTAVREMLEHDPTSGAMALGYLEAVKIKGPLIWLCYKDICDFNVSLLMRKISEDTIPIELEKLAYSGYHAPKRFRDV